MSHQRTLIGIGLAFLAVAASIHAEDPPMRIGAKDIEKLVKDLSADRFPVREAAAAKLIDAGEAAVPELEKALKSSDFETSRRATTILAEIRTRGEEREVKKLLTELDKVPLDRFIARIAKEPDRVTNVEWKALGRIVEAAVAKTNEAAGTKFKVPVDLANLRTVTQSRRGREIAIRLATVRFPDDYPHFDRSAIVCSGHTTWIPVITNSMAIVDGEFAGAVTLRNSIILCRGDFIRAIAIRDSVVLCGGELRGATTIENSVIRAAKFDGCEVSRDNVYLNLPKIKSTRSDGDRYVETKEDPLSLIRFASKKEEK